MSVGLRDYDNIDNTEKEKTGDTHITCECSASEAPQSYQMKSIPSAFSTRLLERVPAGNSRFYGVKTKPDISDGWLVAFN